MPAVRPIPTEWAKLHRLQVVVSIDGLQPEHDVRRTPATYDRILKHIAGHQITVHCTVTRQQVRRDGYLQEFLEYWQANPHTRLIWVSLYTPQVGELSMERLTPEDRARVVADLRRLRPLIPKLQMLDGMLNVYAYDWGDGKATAGVRAYLFSADAADYVRREEPAWQAWLQGLPVPA